MENEPENNRQIILAACLVFILIVVIPLIVAIINYLFPVSGELTI